MYYSCPNTGLRRSRLPNGGSDWDTLRRKPRHHGPADKSVCPRHKHPFARPDPLSGTHIWSRAVAVNEVIHTGQPLQAEVADANTHNRQSWHERTQKCPSFCPGATGDHNPGQDRRDLRLERRRAGSRARNGEQVVAPSFVGSAKAQSAPKRSSRPLTSPARFLNTKGQ